VARFYRIWWIK